MMEEENQNKIEATSITTDSKKKVDKKIEKKVVSMNSAMENLKGIIAKNNEVAKRSTKKPIGEEYSLNDTKKKVNVEYDLTQEQLSTPNIAEEIKKEQEDIASTKKYAWLAYILFFIPLCINHRSDFVRLHANEGLDVFFIDVFASICLICGLVIKYPANLAIIGYLLIIMSIGLFILTTITKIFQIIQVCRGKKNQTPWLWKTRFIK